MTSFADLAHLPEDERIRIIGRSAENGARVGFFVDDDAAADRYLAKLRKSFKVSVLDRQKDLVKNTVFVKVGPITN